MNPGDLIAGRYRLLRPIGEGATGTVWAARHEHLGREYALKIAAAGERATEDARAQFLREVRIVGTLRHRNIVDIADAGEAGEDRLYLAMELLDGEELADRIARAPLSPTDALAVIAGVCRGLAAAHAAGVVHRDVKPENIFLARGANGGVVPKLLDFGVSSSRGMGGQDAQRVYGTPAYMSPEQALGEGELDHRVDLWAVGVVLYEMLTGRHPFTAESYVALLPRIIEAPYPPLPESMPAEVVAVVAGCLAKPAADRYASADALLSAVESARAALPEGESARSGFFVEAAGDPPPASLAGDARAPAPRPRRGLGIAIVAALVAVGITVALMGARRRDGAPAAAIAPAAIRSTDPAPRTPPIDAPAIATAAISAPASANPAPAPVARATATPSSAASAPTIPARAPGKGRVTRVDNAGF